MSRNDIGADRWTMANMDLNHPPVIPQGDGWFEQKNQKPGFFDLPKHQVCSHYAHNPPSHLYIPPGQGYRHICPGCGHVTVMTCQVITCAGP